MEMAGITRRDVDLKLQGVGDYVKIDHLNNFLKKPISADVRKYVFLSLAKLYEERKMFLESGKCMKSASDLNATFQSKMADLLKASEMFIKGGHFDDADIAMNSAVSVANEIEKRQIKEKVKGMYFSLAQDCLKRAKRKNAMEIYEKLLFDFSLAPDEKRNVQNALLDIYQRIGKVKEMIDLKKSMSL